MAANHRKVFVKGTGTVNGQPPLRKVVRQKCGHATRGVGIGTTWHKAISALLRALAYNVPTGRELNAMHSSTVEDYVEIYRGEGAGSVGAVAARVSQGALFKCCSASCA